ncbi:MAG: choline-sulfatase [Planctomyces sp.]|nr:choline-sulfatase [Planctomyces sp.]
MDHANVTSTIRQTTSFMLVAITFAGLAVTSPGFAADAKVESKKRPNVLMIVIDDQNDWVEPLGGHPLVQTPSITQLADRGTTFTNAHCQAPLCNPSRTSVMLGLRSTSTGIHGLSPWFRRVPELKSRVTLPQAFRQAGYRTLTTGKIYHGPAGGPKDRLQEFDVWGPAGGIGKKPAQRLVQPAPHANPLVDWGTFPHEDSEKGDYQITTWAIDQLQSLRTNERTDSSTTEPPFLLCVGYFLPHVPCYVTPPWLEKYPDDDSILPLIQPHDRDDTPRFSWYLHWKLPEPRLAWLQKYEEWRSLVRAYLASTSFVDAQIGRLLEGLSTAGHADDTLVVLWSDHGWHLGEQEITGKNTLWERSTRVPLIFAGPGIAPGAKCSQPAELLDIYPTLAALCELQPPVDLEGLSLVTQLQDAGTSRERPAITSHNQGNHAIRSLHHRYIRYADGSEELYDHRTDPHEWRNLANDPAQAAIIKTHRQWLPLTDLPPAIGSKDRVLTYDATTDTAVWEGEEILRTSKIPE